MKTAKEILKSHEWNEGDGGGYTEDAILNAMEEYKDQFVSPPVIVNKEENQKLIDDLRLRFGICVQDEITRQCNRIGCDDQQADILRNCVADALEVEVVKELKKIIFPVVSAPVKKTVTDEEIESILKNVCIDYTHRWSAGIISRNHKTIQDYIQEIRDLFSLSEPKSDAVEFAEWIIENSYVRYLGSDLKFLNTWYKYNSHDRPYLATSELYTIFIEQKQK